MYEMRVWNGSEWQSVRPRLDRANTPPFRYDCEEDAKLMLKKLFPDEQEINLKTEPV